ncbi:hypothetical protein EVG20_g1491 [Dentipellis fragilis]|uniref:F-box domain-containing protein n=1 Tax=Dentipellis fragilis TaxID=205917 RepID=A0A4Y9ZCH1_9AGAM|nr:hypothetical protein EVG20_g1491 [Dentipellis fragilis]
MTFSYVDFCLYSNFDLAVRRPSSTRLLEPLKHPGVPTIAVSLEHGTNTPNSYAHFPMDGVFVQKTDALALALASRQFREPALDALWHSMLSVKPLLDFLIPPSEAVRYMEDSSAYSFSGIMACAQWMSRADWSRYNYYARRVRYIKISEGDDMVTTFCFHALSVCSSHPTLLPNLRFLHWGYFVAHQAFYHLPLFVGSRLTTLALDMEILQASDITALVSVFSTVRISCPSLNELVLLNQFHETIGEGNAGVTELLLSTFPSLKFVDIRCETQEDTWACLAKMPQLRSLKSTFLPGEEGTDDPAYPMGDALKPKQDNFVSLEHLTVVTKNIIGFIKLLASLSPPRNLKTLDIRTLKCPTASEIEIFAKVLPSCCLPTTLTTLCLASARTGLCDALDSAPPLPASTLFAPFLQFRNMQCFTMRWCAVELDNAFLNNVAVAWTQLRSLNLYGSDHQLHSPTTTVQGLIPLAKHCHRLERLLIPVANLDCDVPVQEFPDGGRKASVDSVVDLILRGGNMDEPSETATKLKQFLKEVFPGWTRRLRQPRFIEAS